MWSYSITAAAGTVVLLLQTSSPNAAGQPLRRSTFGAPAGTAPTTKAVAAQYAKLPLAFERHGANYVAHGTSYTVDLVSGAARIIFPADTNGGGSAIAMEFPGGGRATGIPRKELPGKVNYVNGRDPRRWQLGLPTYQRVSYEGIYPGIDVDYYGNQGKLEFDLSLKPGADPGRLRLKFSGTESLKLDGDGALSLHVPTGDVKLPLPTIYQEVEGSRRAILGHYILRSREEVGFEVEAYDRSKPLVIDPTIVYAGLLGGGTSSSVGSAIALDSSGNTYVTGNTYASDFPTANASYPQTHKTPDGFVTKIDPTGTTILYSTYIGGSGTDVLEGIAIDSAGAAWVTGYTSSIDFPVVGGYQSTLSGTYNAVVLKLGASGNLLYSTYFGSSGSVWGRAVGVDSTGSAYVAGYLTSSSTVPTTTGALLTAGQGDYDAFVAKLGTSGTLIYSTYLGGAGYDIAQAIAVDSADNAYVTGSTGSSSFTGAPGGGAQSVNHGNNAFVAKLNQSGSALVYFTYLGGSGSGGDGGQGIAVDSGGNAYVGGYTSSVDFPTTNGAFQPAFGLGSEHGFVAKLNNTGSAFIYVSYLGGNRQDYVNGLAIDSAGDAYVTGSTESDHFPMVAPIQGSLAGNPTSLFQTINSGSSWAPFDTIIGGVVSAVLPDPGASGVIVVATDSGVFRTVNGGASWTQTLSSYVYYAARSLGNNQTIYALGESAYRSMDGGITWGAPGALGDYCFLVADPLSANTAYAGCYTDTIYKTTDGGATWNIVSTGLTSNYVSSFVASPDGSLYMDTYNGVVYKSTNQGVAWASFSSGLPSCCTGGLAVSLSNPSVLYRSSGYSTLYKTTNAGATWSPVTGVLPAGVTTLAVSPTNSSVIYAATGVPPQLYLSTDGGSTWNAAATGLGIAEPIQIVFDPLASGTVYLTAYTVSGSGFVAEIDPAGSSLVYSTYLGGNNFSNASSGVGIAAADAGDVFVTGRSDGSFPEATTPWSAVPNTFDAFVARVTHTASPCTYAVSPLSQIIYGGSQSVTFSVVAPAGCAWTASSNQPWATVASGASASGAGLVYVAVPATNTSGQVQSATLTIASQTTTLTEAPSSCRYTLSPASPTVPATGGSIQVNVTTGAGCPWSVVNNYPNVVTITSSGAGTGSGTANLAVASTAAPSSRRLTVMIGNSSINITQAGYCTYVMTPPSILLGGTGGSGSVAVNTQSGCGWTAASSNTSWLTVTAGSSGIGSGTVSYAATANTGANRTATLNIGGTAVSVIETSGQAYLISTLAGGIVEPPTAAAGTSVSIPASGVAVDGAGNVYFASPTLNSVFMANSSGVVTRIAGTGVAGYSGDSGAALSAQLNSPYGVAVDSLGDVFIADRNNSRVRKVASNGTITTVAGGGNILGDGSAATSAQLGTPQGVAVDSHGNIFLADEGAQRIRKVDTNGIITTYAGTGTYGFSGDGSAATAAKLAFPNGVAVDSRGNLYIADSFNARVRKVALDGSIATVAGGGSSNPGDGGPATSAGFGLVQGVAIDSAGNLYFSETYNRIHRVDGAGIITTVAGKGGSGYAGDTGPATGALLSTPLGVAVDAVGNLYIADVTNSRVRVVSAAAGIITTLVGGATGDGGPAVFGALYSPTSVVSDGAGNTYISGASGNITAQTDSHRVRKVAANGTITTVAGTGTPGFSGDGGPATSAQINNPAGMAIDSLGNLYISDSWNQRIRMVDTHGVITTIAGSGGTGFAGDGGAATSAKLNYPTALTVDSHGNLYMIDSSNLRIRMIDANGIITTVAGDGTSGYSGDGGAATSAHLSNPAGLAADSAGNLYIGDVGNYRIRKVALNGIITTVAGNGTSGYSGDGGPATSATFNYPAGIAVDATGNVYVADVRNGRIRKMDLTGIITTVAGNGNASYAGDGGPAVNASFYYPDSVFADVSGNIFVADTNNLALRQLTPVGTQPLLTIQSTHTGKFVAGSSGQYSVTVTNAASAGAPSGTVTVVEIVPAVLTITTMTGNGWTCGTSTCTRTNSDALAAGSSYPSIIVTVSVGSPVPTQLTNQVTVSGGGAALAGAEDLTLMSGATPCDVTLDSQARVVDVQHLINEALGVIPACNDLNSDGVVNVADLQVVTNAVLGLGCTTGSQ